MKYLVPAVAIVAALSACATPPKDFYANPAKPKDTALCRAFLETDNLQYKRDTAVELTRRGLTLEECQNRMNMESAAIAGIALVATGVAVAAACSDGCGGGGSSYSVPDQDCAGGRGDGPYFIEGPVRVSYGDPHGLDADGDGIGCEASDIAYGR